MTYTQLEADRESIKEILTLLLENHLAPLSSEELDDLLTSLHAGTPIIFGKGGV